MICFLLCSPARIGRINSAIVSTSIVADCNVTTSSIDDAVNISLYHEVHWQLVCL